MGINLHIYNDGELLETQILYNENLKNGNFQDDDILKILLEIQKAMDAEPGNRFLSGLKKFIEANRS
ncbi:MAG: hypothetical protein WAT79_02105 [Saprospiraceae bacterium]